MKDESKSILKEALTDYKEIMEAADANAKKKLAEEFPEKFTNILKEELQKNKSVKESYKKIEDEPETNKESDMKKETVKEAVGTGKPFATKPKEVQKVAEDVKITDTVGKADPYKEKAKGVTKIEEEREKDFVADVEAKTPNIGKGEGAKGKNFNQKIKGPTSGKPISNISEEFNITELDVESVGTALENASPNDQVLTMEEIESEISSMENLGEELDGVSAATPNSQGGAYDELVEMRNKLDSMIKGMGNAQPTSETFDDQSTEFDNAGLAGISEEDSPITDADIDAVLGDTNDAPVEEAHGVTYGNRRNTVGKHTPAPEYLSKGELDQSPAYMQEAKKKISGLIEENKKLTKKLNETKKYKESVTGLVESYKSAIGKYRNQLKEMAIFNTNLANVNNLLVNEGLALTQEDKIKIINEFKKVDSIASSQNVYKKFLTEMKGSKKTISESIEDKVSASIQPSSKQKLDEVVEKTAYADNAHINRMKTLIESMEKRGKKNNL